MLQVVTQLSLFLANRPGTFAAACRALAAAKVNIYAIATSDTVDHSVVRMIVDEPGTALRVLEQRGTLVLENEVLMIEGANAPGSLASITQRLADAGINLEYAYCATAPKAKRGLLILRTANIPKSLKTLNTPGGDLQSSPDDPLAQPSRGKKSGGAKVKSR